MRPQSNLGSWVEGRRGRGCGASGGFVRCGLMVVETEGEEMTFVEDKSRMTHSGFFRSGAPSTRMLDLQLQPHPPRPTSEMQANNATARTRSRSSILQSRLACSDRISDRRLVVNGARKPRCRVVLEKELRARMAGKWQPRQPLTNSNQFAPALTSSPLHSSLFTLHLGRDRAAREAHSTEGQYRRQ